MAGLSREKKLNGLKVFVVEDDFLIQMDLKLSLETAGAHVVTASSVHEGLVRADGGYDVAVVDVCLPDGDVFEVADALLARQVKLIFHSGTVECVDLQDRYSDAIALSKPTQDQVLVDAVYKIGQAPDLAEPANL